VPGEERERAIAFIRARDLAQVDRVEPCAWGRALITESLPKVHDLNFLLADAPEAEVHAAALAAEAERVMGSAGLGHRRVNVDDEEDAARLAPGFDDLGWQAERFLVMAHRGAPDRTADLREVREVEILTLRAHREQIVRSEPFGKDDELVQQILLKDERVAALPGTRAFAIVRDGLAVSACHLYSDGTTAQIESVSTLRQHRGRGYARAVVQAALSVAHGHDLLFLVAELEDWPQQLYRKLGFDAVGTEDRFLKIIGSAADG
jgi:ribosomal protein S18 acetylase RimI-like enzyme